jgi:flagellar biosynthesis chaperone FliJ
MKQKLSIITIIFTLTLFSSCQQMSNKVDEKLNKLSNKADQLDSIINKEVDKVMALDSIINLEGDKVKKLDSIINNSTSKIDSIAKSKMNTLRNLVN